MFGELFKGTEIHYEEFTGNFGESGCYFLGYDQHCYALFWNSKTKIVTIGDGSNTFETNYDVASYIRGLLGRITIRKVHWDQNQAVDHCTSAAILINLELFRDFRAKRFRRVIDAAKYSRKRVTAILHKYKSNHHERSLVRKRYICTCDKVFRIRKKYLCHRMKCNKNNVNSSAGTSY